MTLLEAIQLGLQRHQAGNFAEAEQIYRQVLAAQPDNPDGLHLLGVLAHQGGQSAAGAQLIQRAIAVNPTNPDYFINHGVILVTLGRLDEAAAAQRHALQLKPDHANAYNNLGYTLQEMDNLPDAITAGLQAVAIDPHQSSAHNNLGTAYLADHQIDRAIACYRFAIQLQPGYSDAYNNLGKALYAKGELDESIACLERAIALRFNYPEAHNNLGNALCDKEQWEKAIACCRQSLALRPDYPAGHWNLGLMLLRQGDFANGWPNYAWRFRVKALGHRFNFPQPWWDGSDLNGRRILLHAEQGLGDTIQFLRYIPEVARRSGKVLLAAQDELLPLLKDFPGVTELVRGSAVPADFDVHCPLLHLAGLFKTTPDTIPATVPYLSADPSRAAQWTARLHPHKYKIGLAWAGRREHTNDRNRSIPLQAFAPLASLRDTQFISLQKGAAPEPPPMELSDWIDELTDFADTAALIANLDLVITVDTSVAHLAGAMGKPVCVLLPLVPDWRWMLRRADSPWYPTMRLFRQSSRGDWKPPIAQIVEAIKNRQAVP